MATIVSSREYITNPGSLLTSWPKGAPDSPEQTLRIERFENESTDMVFAQILLAGVHAPAGDQDHGDLGMRLVYRGGDLPTRHIGKAQIGDNQLMIILVYVV